MPRAFVIAASVGAALSGAAALLEVNRRSFRRRQRSEVESLFTRAAAGTPSVLTVEEVAPLPAPVRRWLDYSGVVGRPRALTVRLKQKGELRPSPGQPWMPFDAVEYYTTDPPGFVWLAVMRPAPVAWVDGTDVYRDGQGHMRIKVLSLFSLGDNTGPEMNQGSLLRYLNEIMWFPSGAVSPYIRWESVDDGSARATMSYQGVEASAIFCFHPDGRVYDMTAQRYRTLPKGYSLDTWSTPITEYGEFDGVRVASAGQAVWHLPDRVFSYIRLHLTALEENVPRVW